MFTREIASSAACGSLTGRKPASAFVASCAAAGSVGSVIAPGPWPGSRLASYLVMKVSSGNEPENEFTDRISPPERLTFGMIPRCRKNVARPTIPGPWPVAPEAGW